MEKDLMRNFSISIYHRTRERYLEFKEKHELTHDETINKLLDTHEEKEQKNEGEWNLARCGWLWGVLQGI